MQVRSPRLYALFWDESNHRQECESNSFLKLKLNFEALDSDSFSTLFSRDTKIMEELNKNGALANFNQFILVQLRTEFYNARNSWRYTDKIMLSTAYLNMPDNQPAAKIKLEFNGIGGINKPEAKLFVENKQEKLLDSSEDILRSLLCRQKVLLFISPQEEGPWEAPIFRLRIFLCDDVAVCRERKSEFFSMLDPDEPRYWFSTADPPYRGKRRSEVFSMVDPKKQTKKLFNKKLYKSLPKFRKQLPIKPF